MSRSGLAIAVGTCVLCSCARDSITPICPAVAPGDLVISELRGAQSGGGADTWGAWVELYNASGAPLDLEGLHVVFTRLDGGAISRAIVRRPLPLAAGGYVVIGRDADDARPPRVDYGMGTDFADSFYTAAHVAVLACDVAIDELTYPSLPTQGTRALGAHPPDATANDDAARWCVDAQANTDPTQHGLPGSPGAENPPCT